MPLTAKTSPAAVTRGASLRVRRVAAVVLPVLVVAAVLLTAVHSRLDHYEDNLTGFVQFGSFFAPYTHPPAGALILHGTGYRGYDGQFYYVLASDPLLLHHATLGDLHHQVFRAWRIAYPALASVLTLALPLSIPSALLVLNLAVVIGLSAGFALYALRRGWSTVWAMVLGLLPGFLFATLRDLTDPVATASALVGLLAWSHGRRRLATAMLTVAVLSREVMVLAVVAIALEACVEAWGARASRARRRQILVAALPVVAIPAAAFLAWQAYVALRYGARPHGSGRTLPLVAFVDDLRAALQSSSRRVAAWDAVYELLIISGLIAALASLRRSLDALTIAAALFGLSMTVAAFGPVWGDTRDSLPMLALLLICGLEQRGRLRLAICSGAAAMTALVPLAISGVFAG